MEFLTRHFGTAVLVTLEGHLTVTTLAELRQGISAALAEGGTTVVLDCRRTEYIDTAGLAALVQLAQELERGGGAVRLAALNEDLQGMVELARANTVLQLFPDADAALAEY